MYSTHNEGKSVVAERCIRTLKDKIYKYMTSISKNAYIDKLDDIVNEYNNTYHRTIKMMHIDVKDNTYINTDKEVNDKDPKFKVGDHDIDTSISKNAYIDRLDDIVNEYNNTYHRTIKMMHIDVKDNTYINTDKEVNDKDPKFKVGDHVRISKYKNLFAKRYAPNWSEEIFS